MNENNIPKRDNRIAAINLTTKVTARAIVIHESKLLLVSKDTSLWATPGGHLESNETLHECVVRETKEETGLDVLPKQLAHVFELIDTQKGIHKIESFFNCQPVTVQLDKNWKDLNGAIKYAKYYSLEKLQHINLQPAFVKHYLKNLLNIKQQYNPYQGVEYK